LRKLVLLASEHGALGSALYPQAVELLERLAVCSGAIGQRRGIGGSMGAPTASEAIGAV
jgi:hypothetical protein